jgi:hypothetical protein
MSSVHIKDVSKAEAETRKHLNASSASEADLTEPMSPSPFAAPKASPSKADKILALISEIGANQVTR